MLTPTLRHISTWQRHHRVMTTTTNITARDVTDTNVITSTSLQKGHKLASIINTGSGAHHNLANKLMGPSSC